MIEPIEDRWDDARAASLDAAGLLLYRSNLLGSDLRITNYGGGNTSAKITETDPLTGEQARTLWVKGSGGDLGSMTRAGFAVLYLARLLGLERQYRGLAQEDDMVDLLPLCAFGKSSVAPSIDTPLHAYLPFEHVDHVHPDSVIAIAAAKDSERSPKRCSRAGSPGYPGSALASIWRSSSATPRSVDRTSMASCSRATAFSPGARRPRSATETRSR